MEFAFPLCDSDLLEDRGGSIFWIEQEVPSDELKERLDEFSREFANGGISAVDFVEGGYFETLFSCIQNFETLEAPLSVAAWKLVNKWLESQLAPLRVWVASALSSEEELCDEARLPLANAVQMGVYVLCRLCELNQTQWLGGAARPMTDGAKRGRKRTVSETPSRGSFDWQSHRLRALELLAELVELRLSNQMCGEPTARMRPVIRHLWSPPIVNENFSNLIVNMCCRMLEDPLVAKAVGEEFLRAIFDVILILVRDFAKANTVALRFIGLLQQFDHLGVATGTGGSLLADAIGAAAQRDVLFKTAFLPHMMAEFGKLDTEAFGREGSTRSFANFLVTLAQRCPEEVMAHASQMAIHLSGDSSSMRSAVLSVLAEIVMQQLSDETQSRDSCEQRDAFLDRLRDHLMDVNALVRLRAVQQWARLAERGAIPLSFLRDGLLTLIADRVQDKASQVRKAAVVFMVSFLKRNPYRDKLHTAEVEEKLAEQQAELKRVEAEDPEFAAVRKEEARWNDELEQPMRGAVAERLSKLVGAPPPIDDASALAVDDDERMSVDEDDDAEGDGAVACAQSLISKLQRLADERSFAESAEAFVELGRAGKIASCPFDKGVAENELDSAVDTSMKFLRDAYLNAMMSLEGALDADIELADSQTEYKEKLLAVKTELRYLEELHSFAALLSELLPRVCRLLHSPQQTDVLEAAEFVVTCAEFNVPGAGAAVHQLCNLIWRRNDPKVRSAVVEAFNRLYVSVPAVDGARSR